MGQLDGDQDEDLQPVLWRMVKARSEHRALGYKANLNRFLGFIDKAEQNQPFWTMDLYERTTMGLALNYLSGKKYAEHVTIKSSAADEVPEGGAATSHDRLTCEDCPLLPMGCVASIL